MIFQYLAAPRTGLSGRSDDLQRDSRASWRKVSGRNFRFRCLVTCPLRPISNGRWVRTSTLDRFGMDGSAPRGKANGHWNGLFLTPAPVPRSERAPLIRPGHRQVVWTLETETAWQASFDRRLDDLRREERERQGHPDRTLGLESTRNATSISKVSRGLVRSSSSHGRVAKVFDQDRARFGGHRAGIGLRIVCALMISRLR